MKKTIDLENWNRKEHFRFFSAMDDPFWGVTTQVDFTRVYEFSKDLQLSFFLCSVHFLLKCANQVEAFKLRIEDKRVVSYDIIHLSPTIGREDGTFGFGFFEYHPDLHTFCKNAQKEIERVQQCSGLAFSADAAREDLIRYSALPWFGFSEMKHAGSFRTQDSVPRVSTGKLACEGKRQTLPVSLTLHHGLADGRDAGMWLQTLHDEQKRL